MKELSVRVALFFEMSNVKQQAEVRRREKHSFK